MAGRRDRNCCGSGVSFGPSAFTLRVLPPPARQTTLAEIPTNEPVPLPTDSSAPPVGQVMPQEVQQTAERSSGGSTTNAGVAATPVIHSAELAGPVRGKVSSPMPRGMAESPDALRLPSLTTWLLLAWIIGCGLVLARFAIGAVRVARLARRATDVPAQLAAEATAVAGRLGVARRLNVRHSREINTPCSTGVLRTLVLLPADLDENASRADVRAVLAHEIAHIAGNDLPWNAALELLSALLWFHPLAWWMRLAHVDACDERCDAVATTVTADPQGYAQLLARVALQVMGRTPAVSLPMARRSQVVRRIALLPSRRGCERLSRRAH